MTTWQFWHVTFPIYNNNGTATFRQEVGASEQEARRRAASASCGHGYATVTNREGLVAAYVGGAEWLPTSRSDHHQGA